MTAVVLSDYKLLRILNEEVARFISEQEIADEEKQYSAEDLARIEKEMNRLRSSLKADKERLEKLSPSAKAKYLSLRTARIEQKDGTTYLSVPDPYPNGPMRPLTIDDLEYDEESWLPVGAQKSLAVLSNFGVKIKSKVGIDDKEGDQKFTDSDKLPFVPIPLNLIQQVGDTAITVRDEVIVPFYLAQLGVYLGAALAKVVAPETAKKLGKHIAAGIAKMGTASIAAGIGRTAAFRTIVTTGLTIFGLGPGLYGLVAAIAVPIILKMALEYFVVQKDVFGVRGGISKGNPKEQERLQKLAAIRAKGQKKWPKEGEVLRGDVDLWPIPMIYAFCKRNKRPPTGLKSVGLARSEGGSGQSKTFMSCEEAKRLYSIASMDSKIIQMEFEQAAEQNGRSDTVEAFGGENGYYPNAVFDMAGFVKFKGVVDEEKNKQLTSGDEGPAEVEDSVETGTVSQPTRSRATASDKKTQREEAAKLNLTIKDIQEFLVALNPNALPVFGIDNKYGSETKTAIVSFQKEFDLEQTGIFSQPEYNIIEKIVNSQGLDAEEADSSQASVEKPVEPAPIQPKSLIGQFPKGQELVGKTKKVMIGQNPLMIGFNKNGMTINSAPYKFESSGRELSVDSVKVSAAGDSVTMRMSFFGISGSGKFNDPQLLGVLDKLISGNSATVNAGGQTIKISKRK